MLAAVLAGPGEHAQGRPIRRSGHEPRFADFEQDQVPGRGQPAALLVRDPVPSLHRLMVNGLTAAAAPAAETKETATDQG